MFDRPFIGPVLEYLETRPVQRSIMIKIKESCTIYLLVVTVSVFGYWDDFVQKATTSCNCGWTNKARIVGGTETGKNEYPFMAVLLDPSDNNVQFCGGSILTQRHVLTAAHCTAGKKPEDILISVGAHDLDKEIELSRRMIYVERIIDHELYKSGGYEANDLSLLLTKGFIPFNKNIGPVCLLNTKAHLDNQMIKVLGWGLTINDGEKPSPVLREVDIRVLPYNNCNITWSKELLKDPIRQICTYTKGKDSCNADSGGPLVWLDPEIGSYALVALVSYGDICGSSKPAVNTDVTYYQGWIKSHIKATFPSVQTCDKVNY